MRASRHHLLVLVAIGLATLNLRAAATVIPALLGRITRDVGLSPTLAGVLGSLPGACFALAGLVAAPLLRRWSAERIMVGLLMTTAAVQIVRPTATAPLPFLLLSALALLALGVGNVILPVVVKVWFPTRIGQITGLYATSIGAGTAVPPLIAVPVADAVGRASTGDPGAALGWQVTLAAWGALAAVAAMAWLVPARHPRAQAQPRAGRARSATGARPASPPMYRSRVAWGVLLVFGTTSFLFYSLVAWFPTRLVDAGVGEAQAGVQLAVLTATGMPLALLVPRVAERTGRASPLVAGFVACLAVGLMGLMLAPDRLTTLWSILFGLGAGGFPLGLTLIGLRTRTAHTTARLSGFVQGLGYGMAATGPFVLGLLHEVTRGWTAPLTVLACALVLLPLGARIVDRRGTVDDDLDAWRVEPSGPPESSARWRRVDGGTADTLRP